MKTDTYTKVVLTGIAIFLGFIAFDYKPSMKAEAGIMGSNEMIAQASEYKFFHLKDGNIQKCWMKPSELECGKWFINFQSDASDHHQ